MFIFILLWYISIQHGYTSIRKLMLYLRVCDVCLYVPIVPVMYMDEFGVKFYGGGLLFLSKKASIFDFEPFRNQNLKVKFIFSILKKS